MLERYFKEVLVERDEYTRLDRWWDRKGENEIDLIAEIAWYANTLSLALDEAENLVSTVLNKSFFWQKASSVPLTRR